MLLLHCLHLHHWLRVDLLLHRRKRVLKNRLHQLSRMHYLLVKFLGSIVNQEVHLLLHTLVVLVKEESKLPSGQSPRDIQLT